MPLYKYVTVDVLKHILNGSIRFTQPKGLNDPFEMLPELYTNNSDLKELNFGFSLDSRRREIIPGLLADDFKSDHCHDISSRHIINNLDDKIGILCLSKKFNCELMWAHYAQEYTGAIIEFDENHEFFNGQFDVKYSKYRLKLDLDQYLKEKEPVPIAEFCVKSLKWEFQEEVRIIRSLEECQKQEIKIENHYLYTKNIPIECIKAVVLGARVSDANMSEIFNLVRNSHIGLSLATVSHIGYEFKCVPIILPGLKNLCISPRTMHMFAGKGGPLGELIGAIEKQPLTDILKKKV
ncbi:MAG: hypothetical protein K0Q57_432 [Gammaproteobacteria bacterium]|jgi:hypothetical protein|nr:hypothetical protein [Gammaproteobacteria bacterium]